MSDQGVAESFRMSPEVQARLTARDNLAKDTDDFVTRLGKAGYNVFKWGFAYPAGFIAEFLMPPGTGWLTRLIPIGVGWGLEKITHLAPNYEKGNMRRFVGALGEGLYRGGAFGLASTMVLNTIFEPSGGKQFTENVIKAVGGLPGKKAFEMVPTERIINLSDGLRRIDQNFTELLKNPLKKLI